MKKLISLSCVMFVLLFGACNQKQKPRYNANQCPFCLEAPGKCLYCQSTAKCPYCKGTGTRATQTIGSDDSKVKKITLKEKCPFCDGSGKCHYCEGKGICRVCKGTGKIEKWEW